MNIFDAHISGSLSVSSSAEISNDLLISGNLTVLGIISGSISGSITNADNSLTASHAPKYTLTSSFNTFTSSYNTGSFSGSFNGDGTNLYNIPASGVTGLNLNKIISGSVSASISPNRGFEVNTDVTFTGALTVVGQISGSFKGDGTNLYNIPASGVTGLNLTQIADGATTASVSNTNGFRINSNTEITGALKLNKVDLGDDIVEITLTDAGGKYYINGTKNPKLAFTKGFKYRFYYNNNNTHPLLFSLTDDGEHNGGTIYTTGVTTNPDPFYIQIEITDVTATTFYYFCDHHVGMGNSISVYSDFLSGQASGDLIIVEPGTLATTGSNNFIGNEKISGSLAVTGSLGISGSLILTGSVDITGSMTLNGQPIGTGKLDETSFNSYTSSNDGRLFAIENSTSSYNTFTSSIDTRIKNEINEENVISGSIQVLITETTGYSTFSSSISTSISTSIDLLSSSVATTTSGLSSSIGSLSSSVTTTISVLSSSIATTTSGLTSTITSLSSSVATTTLGLSSSLSSSIGILSSSVALTTLNLNNRVDSIETTTGSLNLFSSSINTTIKSKLDSESVISGSGQILITGTTGYSTFSSSIATTTSGLSSVISSLSSSVAITTNGLSSSVSSLSSSVATTTSDLSSSIATTTSNLSSNISSLSSSVATTTLNTKNRVDSIESKTGSYATTGSNIFQGTQTITGSLYVSQDLIIGGSSSIQHITSSQLNIGDNIITVNAINPSVRFGGLSVIDSGSNPQLSGSILFDSVKDEWLFVHQTQGIITSSVLLTGPMTFNDIGNEAYLTLNRLTKGTGLEHLADSNITDTGTLVSINSNTEIDGTLNVTGNITNPNISAIQSSTASLNSFTSSLLTAIELTGSNLTVRGDFLVKGTTTNVNTSTLDVDNNLINLNGNGASFAGIRIKDTTGPILVSGSILWDSSNDYWIAGQLGSEQRLVRETEFNNAVTRIGNVETSTGSLNSFTSSINTTIKNRLNTEGVLSSSIQVNHNATTNYVANQHIDHTTVSITAGNGLTGGGDISTTRTINIGAGNGITVNADDIAIDTASATFTTGVKSKLNTDGVISGSAQIDGSLLGSNKTITIGSTSTTLGGTSTSLAGLTSVTSTAFTGSLQGLATSETLSTVTGRGASTSNAITINNSTGGLNLNRPATSNYTGLYYQTGGSSKWFIGLRENLTSNNYICYSETLAADVLTLNQTTGVATFGYNMTAANFSGTHSGTSSGTNTGDETLARINALAITTVGTITSGIWNGTAIGNAYLANSSFNIGTTSISLGRASASQTLTGVSIDGASASAPILTASGGLTTQQGNGTVGYVYALASSTTGLFAASDNSNGILTVNRHPDNYYSQLGFSSNGNLYYRSFSATAINTSQAWKTIIDSGNIGSQTVSNVSGTVAIANGGTAATSASGARTNLGLVIGTDVLAQRSFGTAANNNTGDFATAAQGTTADAALARSGGTMTGNLLFSNKGINMKRDSGVNTGISWYSTTYSSWCDYMSPAATTGCGPNGNITAPSGTYVTSWALRRFIESEANYGWTWESGTANQTTPTVRAELRASDGLFSVSGAMYSAGSLVKTSANSSYSTTFSSVSSVTVTHSLGTKDVAVFVYDSSDNMFWPSSIVTTSTSVVTITFSSSRSGRVVVVR